MKSKKVAFMGLMATLAMIFGYIEFLVPISVGIPGIMLGLANIVLVVCLYVIRPREAFLINFIRISLSSLLFGNSLLFLYSLAGGALSFAAMFLLKKNNGFSVIGVSLAGGVAHNTGQIIVAICILENIYIAYYLPALIIAGAITGLFIGFLSSKIIPPVRKIFPG